MGQLIGNGGVPKETQRLIKAAQKAGWKVRTTGRNHVLFVSPEGGAISASGTPRRGGTNPKLVSTLRRLGLDV